MAIYASSVDLSYGPMSAQVDFQPFRTTPESLTTCCPKCYKEDGKVIKVSQFYQCSLHTSHGNFLDNMCVKARKDGKTLNYVGTAEEVVKAKEIDESEKKILSLHAHNYDEVMSLTYPLAASGGTAYILRPHSKSELIPILMELVGFDGKIADDKMLVGEIILRNFHKIYMLRTWNSHLVAHELARPSDLVMYEPASLPAANPSYVSLVRDLIEADSAPFLEDVYADKVRGQLNAFIASRLDNVSNIVDAKPEPSKVVDLTAALEAAVQAKKSLKQAA